MELSEHDLRRVMNPEPLTIEQQRQEDRIQRAIALIGPLSAERLRAGVRVDPDPDAPGWPVLAAR